MCERMHGVLDQGGDPGRLDPVPGHVANKQADLSVLRLEDVVEIATDLSLLVAER